MYRVLYVDDEPDLLDLGKLFLEATRDFSVDTETQAQTAVLSIGSQNYDAIISDYQMPGMDGIAFLKGVRERYGDLPFILFTGRGREEVVIQALNNGADFYLQKGGEPTSQFTELAHKIRQAVIRRNAVKALAESEARFRDLTENSLDTIMLFDRDLRHLYVNPNIETQMGIPPSQFIGKTHAEIGFPAELVELADVALREVFVSGKTARREFQLPNGIWVDWLLVPIKGPEGNVLQVITSARDITERMKTEEKIRLAEFSLEHSGITTFWLDRNARVIRANLAACNALGYTMEEFSSLRVHDFDPNYQEEAWRAIWDRIAQEKDVVIESAHKRKDGTVFPVEIASSFFEYGGRELIFSFARNITDRKRAEESLRAAYDQIAAREEELTKRLDQIIATQKEKDQTEQNFRNLVDNAPDSIFIETQDIFRYVNNATLRLLGASSPEELLGTPTFDRIHPSLHDNIRRRVKDLTVKIRPVELQDEIYLKMDGTPVDVEVIAVPYEYLGEHGALVIVRDVTVRKQAEQELRAAYEQISAAEEELRGQYDELARSERQIRQSEEQYRRLTEKLPIPVCVADDNEKITFINNRFTRMFGYTSEDIPTLHEWWELAYPDEMYRSEVLTTWTRAIDAAVAANTDIPPMVYNVTCKDGTVRQVEISGIQFEGMFLATFIDMTERMRAIDKR